MSIAFLLACMVSPTEAEAQAAFADWNVPITKRVDYGDYWADWTGDWYCIHPKGEWYDLCWWYPPKGRVFLMYMAEPWDGVPKPIKR